MTAEAEKVQAIVTEALERYETKEATCWALRKQWRAAVAARFKEDLTAVNFEKMECAARRRLLEIEIEKVKKEEDATSVLLSTIQKTIDMEMVVFESDPAQQAQFNDLEEASVSEKALPYLQQLQIFLQGKTLVMTDREDIVGIDYKNWSMDMAALPTEDVELVKAFCEVNVKCEEVCLSVAASGRVEGYKGRETVLTINDSVDVPFIPLYERDELVYLDQVYWPNFWDIEGDINDSDTDCSDVFDSFHVRGKLKKSVYLASLQPIRLLPVTKKIKRI